MEEYCSTGQSPQRAVVPMEEEEKFVKENVTYEPWLLDCEVKEVCHSLRYLCG
jgi:hypothetical protein